MSGMVDYPDMDRIVERWSAILDSTPDVKPGATVRLIGRGISGIVMSVTPLVVRDGTGFEHSAKPWTVRAESAL